MSRLGKGDYAALARELVEMASPPPAGVLSHTSEHVRGVGWCTSIFVPAGDRLSIAEHQSWLETALGRGRQP